MEFIRKGKKVWEEAKVNVEAVMISRIKEKWERYVEFFRNENKTALEAKAKVKAVARMLAEETAKTEAEARMLAEAEARMIAIVREAAEADARAKAEAEAEAEEKAKDTIAHIRSMIYARYII